LQLKDIAGLVLNNAGFESTAKKPIPIGQLFLKIE
jgi:hypothetical protein